MRRLAPYQTYDPARGMFLVHAREVKRVSKEVSIFGAPLDRGELSNTVYFIPTEQREEQKAA